MSTTATPAPIESGVRRQLAVLLVGRRPEQRGEHFAPQRRELKTGTSMVRVNQFFDKQVVRHRVGDVRVKPVSARCEAEEHDALLWSQVRRDPFRFWTRGHRHHSILRADRYLPSTLRMATARRSLSMARPALSTAGGCSRRTGPEIGLIVDFHNTRIGNRERLADMPVLCAPTAGGSDGPGLRLGHFKTPGRLGASRPRLLPPDEWAQ